MIEKLRRRLTFLVLGGLLLILGATVFLINFINWTNISNQAQTTLQALVDNNGHRPGMEPEGARTDEFKPEPLPASEQDAPEDSTGRIEPDGADRPQRPHLPERDSGGFSAANLSNFYTIELNSDGTVDRWFSDRSDLYSEEQIQKLVDTVQALGANSGRVGDQFYRTAQRPNGTLLVVLDARLELSNANQMLRITILVGFLAYLILGLGGMLLIRRMTKPVQEAFEKQKQFVWDASHELKTPLAVISANAEVLAGEIGENEWLGYIQSEVRRTNKLVQNLLALARMDKGTAEVKHQRFDLSQSVLQVALPFESTVFEAGKTMDLQVEPGLSYTGDQDMLQQLVVILLSNAVKYSDPAGAINLSLRGKGEKRILKVYNTGPAISPEAIPYIFDRFYREDAAHNRDTPGNGLGLAIAKTIVETHKGKITVESTEGAGTTFIVTLP